MCKHNIKIMLLFISTVSYKKLTIIMIVPMQYTYSINYSIFDYMLAYGIAIAAKWLPLPYQ